MDANEPDAGWTDAVESGSPSSSGISIRVEGNGVASGVAMPVTDIPPSVGVIAEIGGVIGCG